jgi:hypothetical protein
LITFLDETLRVNEEKDYLGRIESHPESYSKDGFYNALHRFGTMTIIHKIDKQNVVDANKSKPKNKKKIEKEKPVEQTVYESYKQRNEIEIMFDSYKNYLKADVSYMQNRYVLEGWLFGNFIAMIAYYKLYVEVARDAIIVEIFTERFN